MAKPVSEEELQLKKRARRRLIGAIALVAGVAAVLPMVLDSEPKSGPQDINIQIPTPEPKGGVTAKVVPSSPPPDKSTAAQQAKPLEIKPPETKPPEPKPSEKAVVEKPALKATDAPKAAVEKPQVKAPVEGGEATAKAAARVPDNPNDIALGRAPKAAQEKTVTKAPEKAAEKAPEKAATKVADKTAEKVPATVAAGPGAFFIQVMALSEADKAKQVQQKIADAGVRAYTEVVTTGAGKVTRVRAGPFASREEADRAQAKLQGIGLEGKVAAY